MKGKKEAMRLKIPQRHIRSKGRGAFGSGSRVGRIYHLMLVGHSSLKFGSFERWMWRPRMGLALALGHRMTAD